MNPYNTKYPFLLVFKEKHGSYHFLIRSIPELFEISLKILTERFEEGWYNVGVIPTLDELFQKAVGVGVEAFDALPQGIKDNLKSKAEMARKDYAYYTEEAQFLESVEKAVNDRDGKAAFQLINDRRDYEYEGFEYEHFSNVEGELPPENAVWLKEVEARRAQRKLERGEK